MEIDYSADTFVREKKQADRNTIVHLSWSLYNNNQIMKEMHTRGYKNNIPFRQNKREWGGY